MENLNTSHLSAEDHSNPSQPLTINISHKRYQFQRNESPLLHKGFKRKPLPQYSQSTNFGISSPLPARNSHMSTHSPTRNLAFTKKELTKLPKAVMENISSLLSLDLSKNQFSEFPSEILKLSNLKTLKMESNYLKRIPNEIYQLSQLENISFASNYIVLVPKTISKLARTLQSLNLSNNHIEILPIEITDLVNLKSLHIQCNFFISLPSELDSLSSLRELGLEWFKYTNPPLGVIQSDKSRYSIIKLFQLCQNMSNMGKSEVNFEDFINHFSITKENIFSMRDPLHRNLLHIATLEQEIGIARYLASYKEHFLHELDQDGQTPLSLAIREEKYFLSRILLLHGADPKIGGGAFGSSLHMVTSKHQLTIFKELLRHGANPNCGDLEGNTPLHLLFSIFSKNLDISQEMAQLLLDHGADPNQLNNDLWTPLHLAIRRGQTDCLRWAVESNKKNQGNEKKMFNLNLKGGSDEWAPLHLAASLSQYEIMNILLENNADVMERTKAGKTARDVAINNPIVMKILKKMEIRWATVNLFQPVSPRIVQEDNNMLKNNMMITNVENIAPNRGSIRLTEGRTKTPSSNPRASAAKLRTASSGVVSKSLANGHLLKGALRLEIQNGREDEERRGVKRAFGREVNKDITEDSLLIGDIDEIAESKEITRVMPKSPNNIQKLQMAQNYRNHLMNILSDKTNVKGNMLRGSDQPMMQSVKHKQFENPPMMTLKQQQHKIDLHQKFIFPNEFSKYIRKFEHYMDEIKGFQNAILSENDDDTPLCEKLKYLFYMRVIHMKLNQVVKKLHSELIPFELFIICESIDDELRKTVHGPSGKGSMVHNNKDSILRSLLFVFENIEIKASNKNVLIKARICQLFGECKYNSARHFLQQLLQNPKENVFLRLEAKASLKMLQNLTLAPTAKSLLFNKEKGGIMLGSPKNEIISSSLTKLVKASFLSPTGTSTIAANLAKHKRPLSYYGNSAENVDEEDDTFSSKISMQTSLGKKTITEHPKNEDTDTLNESQEMSIKTEVSPRIMGSIINQGARHKKMEVKGVPKKLGVENYFSQH